MDKLQDRRDFLRNCILGVGALFFGYISFFRNSGKGKDGFVWQLDPEKCIQCGKCSTNCILQLSAVKCVHAFNMCGYCQLCGAYFTPEAKQLNTAAENQLCPMGALKRKFIESPFYEYTIDEKLCIACGKCVKGCSSFGNGSLFLQVRHDICLNCNECSIARTCPANAFRRVPSDSPYLLKGIAKGL